MKFLSFFLLLLTATPTLAGEADRRHEFRDAREALIRQLSPEGRYCRECHTHKRINKRHTQPRMPEVPIPATALLFASGIGAIIISRKWRKR